LVRLILSVARRDNAVNIGMNILGERILWQRVNDYLGRYQPTVVGITGSTGRTMVTSALALALSGQRLRVAPTSVHTRAGVALAALGIKREKARASWMRLLVGSRPKEFVEEEPSTIVLEFAADKPGDIDFFARTLPITVAAVTNVHSINLHLYNSIDLIAHEQTSLVAALPPNGIACLNRDDPNVAAMAAATRARVIWFGTSADTDVRLAHTQRLPGGGYAAEFTVMGRSVEVHLPHVVASFQLIHITAALAVMSGLKENIGRAARRLSRLAPPAGQMRLLPGRGGSRLLDDSSDATPERMIAALGTLAEMPVVPGKTTLVRRIAILGDIDKLGARALDWHRRVGEKAARSADIVIAVGENMRAAGAAALKSGAADVHHFNDNRTVGTWLREYLKEGDLVLVSGGQAMNLAKVVVRLLAHPRRDIG
jgi:UDP-N-acetylmuramoyl-tripeptide--D-alanyl-D-alanine ligase